MSKEPLMNQDDAQMAWDDLRTSPAFPAIVGGLAGALGGAALMFIFSRLSRPKQTLPAAYDANGNPMNVVYLPAPSAFRILGFTPGDLVALATVGLSLYRQFQELQQAQAEQNQNGNLNQPLPQGSTLPPSPASLPPSSATPQKATVKK